MSQILHRKASTDIVEIEVCWKSRAPLGASIEYCEVEAIRQSDMLTDNEVLIETEADIEGMTTTARMCGGTSGETYLLVFVAYFSNGDEKKRHVLVRVRDLH